MRTLFIAATMWAVMAQANAQSGVVSEYQVKAAFLYNFTKFVEWPPEVSSGSGPLRVCVLGKNPFGSELETTVQGRTIAGHQLIASRPHTNQEARRCQVLFISSSDPADMKNAIAGVRGAPVLTIGDNEEFLRAGGMINFVLEDQKVRFEINPLPAEREHLKISAKLQALARSIVAVEADK